MAAFLSSYLTFVLVFSKWELHFMTKVYQAFIVYDHNTFYLVCKVVSKIGLQLCIITIIMSMIVQIQTSSV